MSIETNNLWGDLPLEAKIRTPVSILKEQASLLTKITNGLLEGQALSENSGADIKVRLRIIAPALGQYIFSILTVTHKLFIYPLTLNDVVNRIVYSCDDEPDFLGALKEVLSSNAVHQAIGSLIAQIKADDDDNDLPF